MLKFKKFLSGSIFPDHVGADDVTGHQVRGELDTRKLKMCDICQRLHQLRLANPRNAFEQYVSFDKQACHHPGNDLIVTNDYARNLLAHALEMIPELLDPAFYVAAHFLLLS